MKSKGLILVFTGDGKGKTTAALGTALRLIGRGGRVGMAQFFKGATAKAQRSTNRSLRDACCEVGDGVVSGEIEALKKFGDRVKVWSFGGGFTWQVSRQENQKAVDQAWKQCCKLLRDPKYDLVIFDEIHIALRHKFLKVSEVLSGIKLRVPSQHIILTGRDVPKSVLKIADLATEMKSLKHPFSKGVPAQPGLDF